MKSLLISTFILASAAVAIELNTDQNLLVSNDETNKKKKSNPLKVKWAGPYTEFVQVGKETIYSFSFGNGQWAATDATTGSFKYTATDNSYSQQSWFRDAGDYIVGTVHGIDRGIPNNDRVVVRSKKDFSEKWSTYGRFFGGGGGMAQPAFLASGEEKLVITLINGNFSAYDLETGKGKWRQDPGKCFPTTVNKGVLNNQEVFVGYSSCGPDYQNYLKIWSFKDGSEVKSCRGDGNMSTAYPLRILEVQQAPDFSPLVTYLAWSAGSGGNTVVFDMNTCTQRFNVTGAADATSKISEDGKSLYQSMIVAGGSSGAVGMVQSFDLRTGSFNWQVDEPLVVKTYSNVMSYPTMLGEDYVLTSFNGNLTVRKNKDGSAVSSISLHNLQYCNSAWIHPFAKNSTVYLGGFHASGYLNDPGPIGDAMIDCTLVRVDFSGADIVKSERMI